MRERKIPQRTCIGCAEKKPQIQLIRFVDTDEGVKMDTMGKAVGRGCYLCKTVDCVEKAEKRKAFQRAFKRNLPPNEFEKLKETVKKEVMKSET